LIYSLNLTKAPLQFDPDKEEEEDEKNEPKGKMAEQIRLPFFEFIKSSFSIGNKYIKSALDTPEAKVLCEQLKDTYDETSIDQIESVLIKHNNTTSKETFTLEETMFFEGFLILQSQINNFTAKNYKLQENLQSVRP
jgi:hypothetical protein